MSVTDSVAVGGFFANNAGLLIPCLMCIAAKRHRMDAAHMTAAGLKWLGSEERARIERGEARLVGLLSVIT
jgi:hypothetical protein